MRQSGKKSRSYEHKRNKRNFYYTFDKTGNKSPSQKACRFDQEKKKIVGIQIEMKK